MRVCLRYNRLVALRLHSGAPRITPHPSCVDALTQNGDDLSLELVLSGQEEHDDASGGDVDGDYVGGRR